MNNFSARPATLLVALILALATLAGCSETPQEKYDNAVEKLQQARDSRNDAQDKVDAKKEELQKSQDKLDDAESNLQEARKKVEVASGAVNKTVNDEVLFRSIQRDVLDKKDFDKSAISVGVKNRVVTLTGNVPDEDTRKRALKLAREQAGVEDVVDELEVGEDETSAPSGQSKQSSQSKQPEQSTQPADKPKPADDNKPQPAKKPAQEQSKPSQPGDEGGDAASQPKPDDNAGAQAQPDSARKNNTSPQVPMRAS